MKMPRPPAELQQRFPIDFAVWGDHRVLSKIDLAGVHIPAGRWTDFGSVPWVARWIVPTAGRALAAYLVHDELYKTQARSRKYADRLMLEVMRWYGVWWVSRTLAYWGVRIGGRVPWRRNGKRLPAQPWDGWPVSRDEE